MSICPVCTAPTAAAFTARVLLRHDADFRVCPACGYLHAANPHWLAEAYSSAIASADTGLVARNLDLADKLAGLLWGLFGAGGRYLDTAGGTGLLTRLLRDRGFDVRWEDPYCTNLLAAGFEADTGDVEFDAVTAIEVLEHLVDPADFIARQLARSRMRTLIFTTELHEGAPPAADWWYYAFEMGQHIGFFQRRTLETLATRHGVRLFSARGVHLLTALPVDPARYRRWLRPGWWQRRAMQQSLRPLTQTDFRTMLDRAGSAQRPQQPPAE